MKISELIGELEKIKNEEGDVLVLVFESQRPVCSPVKTFQRDEGCVTLWPESYFDGEF